MGRAPPYFCIGIWSWALLALISGTISVVLVFGSWIGRLAGGTGSGSGVLTRAPCHGQMSFTCIAGRGLWAPRLQGIGVIREKSQSWPDWWFCWLRSERYEMRRISPLTLTSKSSRLCSAPSLQSWKLKMLLITAPPNTNLTSPRASELQRSTWLSSKTRQTYSLPTIW